MHVKPSRPGRVRFAGPLLGALALASLIVLAAPAAEGKPRQLSAGAGGAFAPGSSKAAGASRSTFARQGMWIWYVSSSSGGSTARIIARAQRSHVGTVYIKAGDGSGAWSQFSTALIKALHRGGLTVCAWQFVYGDSPVAEAKVGATAVSKGADCLAIDAETAYEGKYASASKYIGALRRRIGGSFPVSLAGFPYADFHPAFPYSVFLQPGGANANQPQMYWQAIGTSVREVYAHTYSTNSIYQAPIYPLGQTYGNPASGQITKFRRFAVNYGTPGVSWWSWQDTTGREWAALRAQVKAIQGFSPGVSYPTLQSGSKGDLVVWAQEYLVGAGQTRLKVTGVYGAATRNAVSAFQQQQGLSADGVLGTKTWQALLASTPASVNWAAPMRAARASSLGAAHGSAPLSASLPAKRDEIGAKPKR